MPPHASSRFSRAQLMPCNNQKSTFDLLKAPPSCLPSEIRRESASLLAIILKLPLEDAISLSRSWQISPLYTLLSVADCFSLRSSKGPFNSPPILFIKTLLEIFEDLPGHVPDKAKLGLTCRTAICILFNLSPPISQPELSHGRFLLYPLPWRVGFLRQSEPTKEYGLCKGQMTTNKKKLGESVYRFTRRETDGREHE